MPTPAFLYDDAYITLASAQALWLGYDPHFAGTPPLYGVTSPFHCLLVAALLAVLPPLWALLASCIAGAAAYVCGLWVFARQEGLAPLEAAGVVVAGLGSGMVSQHMVNGLETSWAMAAVVWLLVAFRRDQPALLAALAGTAPFVRPELAIVAAALVAFQCWRSPARTATVVAWVAVAALPWLILLLSQIGSVIPSTLAAKRDWYAEGCWTAGRRLSVVGTGLRGWLWAMPVTALGLLGLLRTSTGRVALGAAILVLAIWAWNVPNVLHSYQRHRYFAPLLPLVLLGVTSLPRWSRPAVVGAAAVAALVSTASVARFEPAAIASTMEARRQITAMLRGQRVDRLLLHDAGYLAFSNAMPAGIDMVGLKTPLAGTLHGRHTGPSCGTARGRALAELAAQTQPTHLVIWGPWDDYFRVTVALSNAGWHATKVATAHGAEPIFVYRLSASDAGE